MTQFTNPFDLKGKRALITGSYRGIGYAMAEGLGKAGAQVIINGRNAEAVDTSTQKLVDLGIDAKAKAFDVSEENQVNQAVAEIEANLGAIDILINNAGIHDRNPITDMSLEQWNNVMKVNLAGPFLLSRAVAKGMIERKSGKIINICSVNSQVARPTISNYATTKGGLVMLTKEMAIEWAPHNIQVNGIGPGYIHTEMNTALFEDKEFNEWICGKTPAGRWGKPDDLAGAAIFLSSQTSNFMNGQIIFVDGGLLSAL